MTIQQAERILGVSEEDDERVLKMRFRKLMREHHPDAQQANVHQESNYEHAQQADEDAHLRRTQQINEAYTLLQKKQKKRKSRTKGNDKDGGNAKTRKQPEPTWRGTIIGEAYAERTIYMPDDIWEEPGTGYIEVIRGRYAWDPDLEEFQCLLYSLNKTALKLLEDIELRIADGYLTEAELKEVRFKYHVRLFHLLARQYIQPITCLEKTARTMDKDAQGRKVYCVDAFIGTKGSSEQFRIMEGLEPGELLRVTGVNQNRITIACNDGQSLGNLSFAEDELYYMVIPILQKRMAQVKCVVDEKSARRGRSPMQIKVDVKLYLRMEQETAEVNPGNLNLNIASLLNEYEIELADMRDEIY